MVFLEVCFKLRLMKTHFKALWFLFLNLLDELIDSVKF